VGETYVVVECENFSLNPGFSRWEKEINTGIPNRRTG
jgi:hypothetical protein